MQEPKTLTSVHEFHKYFNHPILNQPQVPPPNRAGLRIELIEEETRELKDAFVQDDIVAAADALADLQYVLSGAILEFGLGDKFGEIFAEVHRSNMSKACKDMDEVEATMKHYLDKDGTETYYVERDGLYFIYRKSDNKTLKSINYSPADIAGILKK